MTQLEEETGITIHEFPSDELYPSCPIRLFPLKNTTQHSNVSKTLKLAAGRNSQRFATVGNHERRIDDVFHVGASLSEAERDAKSFDSRKKKSPRGKRPVVGQNGYSDNHPRRFSPLSPKT